ncbi:hypothetical protein HYZ80_02100 [Candidatus Parcubacteria bacterium]|nr:hypothetical protein [Candidatus Parcubacteria bacterium]
MTDPGPELGELVRKLVSHGEDAEELSYWQDIFTDLTAAEQEKLLAGLRQELAALERLESPDDAQPKQTP